MQKNGEVPIEISELRARIDELNEQIISGLAVRSRYSLNEGAFSEQFAEGLSWFFYRLKKEQSLDAEFGRFLYYDQRPFFFGESGLAPSKVSGIQGRGIKPIVMDLSKEIIDAYRKILWEQCHRSEDRATFGETTKLDVGNVLALNERVVGMGEQVAGFKIKQHPELLLVESAAQIRGALVDKAREKAVIGKMSQSAERQGIGNVAAVEVFAQRLLDLTLDAQVNYILARQKMK